MKVKIQELRDAKKFNDYRDYLIGKRDKTYFTTIDVILNVTLEHSITYTVQDIKSGIIRKHCTFIKKSEVF